MPSTNKKRIFSTLPKAVVEGRSPQTTIKIDGHCYYMGIPPLPANSNPAEPFASVARGDVAKGEASSG
jgi:hypothetical protein